MNNSIYRSIIFVPAEEKRLNKIESINADAFIIDLEDSIKSEKKNTSLDIVYEFLLNNSIEKNIFVRINPDRWDIEKKLLDFDVSLAVPKVENLEDILKYKVKKEKKIFAFIESPIGLINIDKIIESKMIDCIGFGAEDYCALTRKKKNPDILRYERSRIVMYSKANGISVYDMVESELDKELFGELVRDSKEMGFDGKLAIHPNQVDVINSIFDIDKEKANKIIEIYSKSDSGFVIIDGQIYEKTHINRLTKEIDC